MPKISNELFKKFTQEKYHMSTGSDQWQNIKIDFEIEDDAIAGTVAHEYYNKSVGAKKVNEFKSGLEKLKIRVDNYNSKDDVEAKEKKILQNKINIGLEIYKIILGNNQ